MREIPLGVGNYGITNDPLNRIYSTTNPRALQSMVATPQDYTEAILLGPLNLLLDTIHNVFGLDLKVFGDLLKGLLGTTTDLLSGLFGWLTPGLGTPGGGVFGPLLGGIAGGLSTLSQLFSWLMPSSLIGAAAGIFEPILNGVGEFLGGLIPGLDASKIISGQFPLAMINGLLDVGGKIATSLLSVPISVITGLLSGGTILGSLIPNLDASKITSGALDLARLPGQVLTTVSGVAQNLVTGLTDALEDLTATGNAIIDSIVDAVLGIGGSLWPVAKAKDALAAQAESIKQTAQIVAELKAAADAESGSGGLNRVIDFSEFPDSTHLPGIFDQVYDGNTGTYGIVSGAARHTDSADPTNQVVQVYALYNDAVTDTDYQRVGGVWTGEPGLSYWNPTPFFLPVPWATPYAASHWLFCRYKDENNWVGVQFEGGDSGTGATPHAYLKCCVGGTVTTLASVTHSFQPNTLYWLEAGTISDIRTYRVIAGASVLISFTDVGSVTQVGAAFRGGGFGATMKGSGGSGTAVNPAPMIVFSLRDNSPTGVSGQGFRAYRSSGSVSAPSGPWPSNCLDTVEYLTSEFTWEPGNQNRLYVSVSDWYVVSIRNGRASTANQVAYLYRNGVLVRSSGTGSTASVSGCWVIYLTEGDYIQPGSNGVGGNLTGSADGAGTFFEVTRVGRVPTPT